MMQWLAIKLFIAVLRINPCNEEAIDGQAIFGIGSVVGGTIAWRKGQSSLDAAVAP